MRPNSSSVPTSSSKQRFRRSLRKSAGAPCSKASLASGYEVSEGMATAWVNGGRVVLRKAANPGYGVELSGGSKSDLLQVRAVAFGNSTETRDTSRDRDIETIWCGEFERLQSLIAKDGGHLAIEHARPVGQFPLKVVEDK